MLLGLDPVLGPDLLHALAAMGHGDRVALVDANYHATRGRRLIQLPGLSAPRVLQAVLSVFPIDTFTSDPCTVMHAKDLRAAGDTEQRLYSLDGWEECPYYTDRERAALAWTEAVTLVHDGHVPDAVYEEARQQFSEEELVNLTMVVVAINGWNRLAISFRAAPGEYQPAPRKAEGVKQ